MIQASQSNSREKLSIREVPAPSSTRASCERPTRHPKADDRRAPYAHGLHILGIDSRTLRVAKYLRLIVGCAYARTKQARGGPHPPVSRWIFALGPTSTVVLADGRGPLAS